MGDDIATATFTREQRQQYREKVRRCLDVFEKMLVEHSFDFDRQLTGLEIELNLVEASWQPAMSNAEVLEAIADPAGQAEGRPAHAVAALFFSSRKAASVRRRCRRAGRCEG